MRPGGSLAARDGGDGFARHVLPRSKDHARPPTHLDAVRSGRPARPAVGRSPAAFALIREWARPARAEDPPGGASLFPEPTVIALGNFDGVHRGHRLLLAEARLIAEGCGARPAVMTPEPHPRTVLGGERRGLRLSSLRDKCRLIAEAGVPVIFAPRFTPAFASLSPEAFVDHVLVRAWRACHVVVGEDFRFGRGRRGDVDRLHRLLHARAVGLSVVPLLEHRGGPVSSERIRRHLAAGLIEEATALLGRPWEVTGRIRSPSPHSRAVGTRGWHLHLAPALLRPPAGSYLAILRLATVRRPAARDPVPLASRSGPWPVTASVSPAGGITIHSRDPDVQRTLEPGRHVVLAWQKACVEAHCPSHGRGAASLPFTIPATRRQMS